MEKKQNKQNKRTSQAQENLERIEEKIKPFVRHKEVDIISSAGKWREASTPTEDAFTRKDFLKALAKVSVPFRRDEEKSETSE